MTQKPTKADLEQRIRVPEEESIERKQAEKALRESDALFRKLFDDHAAVKLIIDPDTGSLIDANEAAAQYYGWSREQLKAMKITEINTLAPEEVKNEMEMAKAKNRIHFEFRHRLADGSIRDVAVFSSSIENKGKVLLHSIIHDITERKRAEKALRESEELFKSYLEYAPDGVYMSDLEGNFLYGNRKCEEIIGYQREELIGKNFLELNLLSENSLNIAVQLLQANMEGKPTGPDEIELISKEGRLIPVEINTSVFQRMGQRIILGFVRDITDRNLAEEALKESSGRYKELSTLLESLFDSIPDVLGVQDKQHGIIRYNQAGYDFLGLTQKDTEGKKCFQLINKTKPCDICATSEVYRTKKPARVEKYIEEMGVWLDCRSYPVFDEEGNITKIIEHLRDITESKQAEEALKKSEGMLRLITDNMSDMIRVTDLQGVNLYTSPSHFKGLGYTPEERAGKSAFDIVHPDDVEHVIKVFFDGLVNKKPAKLEYRIKHAEGHYVWLETVGDLLKDDRGEVTAVVTSSRDITERKRSEEMLRRSEEKFRFLTENMNDNIFTMNLNLQTTYISQSIEKILGFTPEERMKQDITEQVTPASMTLIEKIRSEELEREEKGLGDPNRSIKFEAEYYHKDGSTVWMENVISGIRDAQGVAVGIHGVSRDITQRKRSEHALLESLKRLHKSLGATVQAMAVTVETRDPYTAGHQRRVADLARSIAQEMNLPTHQIEGIRMASTIHDIGKISVPAEILSKPTKLTNIEFDLIKTHAQSGYDILKDIDFPWPVARMILEHHEKIDGSGYPNGSVGENILLESKILAVADVVEAMASHRPYRPSLGIDAAFKELEENKGTKYDAAAVEACLNLFRGKGYQFVRA
ncbi:MAG: PAS domain S-box protein [Deltaproteobacteria bacterium]|nr:PAS domain S-box protein [Deltaproteobacteria bacterium]